MAMPLLYYSMFFSFFLARQDKTRTTQQKLSNTVIKLSNMNIPDSPSLPSQEIEIPETTIPASLGAELDLDDDSEDEGNYENKDNKGISTEIEAADADVDVDVDMTDEDLVNPLACNIPQDKNYETPMLDFSDPIKAPIETMNPFGSNLKLQSSDPIPIKISIDWNLPKLNDLQEQKLLEYVEEKHMIIQRGFVKYLASMHSEEEQEQEQEQQEQEQEQEQQDNNDKDNDNGVLLWPAMVNKLEELLEFVWYTMTQIKGIPIVYHQRVILDGELLERVSFKKRKNITNLTVIVEKQQKELVSLPSKLITKNGNQINVIVVEELKLPTGVGEHIGKLFFAVILKIMGDIIDYVVKYRFQCHQDWILCLLLLGKIDNFVSILIDYGKVISTTDKVRLSSIVQRTKVALVALLERYLYTHPESASGVEALQQSVGEVLEGVVDRVCA